MGKVNRFNSEDLSKRLDEFVQAAKSTSRQLSRFSSRVAGVVDQLLAMDEFALRGLERAAIARDATTWDAILYPFRNSAAEAEAQVLSAFIQAAKLTDTLIQRLILDAELALNELDVLDNLLEAINDVVEREQEVVGSTQKEVLAKIWTTLGGNRAEVRVGAGHLGLLNGIGSYRKKAQNLVGRSLVQLHGMQSDLEELRERVARPALLEAAGEKVERIPLEVHINSIRRGVDRLSEEMARARGLSGEWV